MSEEWKGETGGDSFFTIWGNKLTPEQEAQRADREAARALAAEHCGPPAAFAETPCPKCGHKKVRARFHVGRARDGDDCFDVVGAHEHLDWQCKRCDYEWRTGCLP